MSQNPYSSKKMRLPELDVRDPSERNYRANPPSNFGYSGRRPHSDPLNYMDVPPTDFGYSGRRPVQLQPSAAPDLRAMEVTQYSPATSDLDYQATPLLDEMQVSWDSPNSPRLQAQAAYDAQERSAVADLLRRYPNMSAQEVLQLTDPSGTIGGEAPPQFFGLGADMGMGAVAPGVYSSDPGAVRAVDGVPTAPMPPFGGDPGAAHYTESPAQIAAPPQEDPTRGMVHKIGASSKEIRTSVQNKVDRNEFAQYLWNMMNATPPEFNPLGFQKSLATPYERTAEKAERAYVPKK